MSSKAVHVSRIGDLALACGVYPLGRNGRYLRFRTLSGATVAYAVPVSARVLDAATADDLRGRLRRLAAESIMPLIHPQTIGGLWDADISPAERRLLREHRVVYSRHDAGWHWNWADAKRRGWLVSPSPDVLGLGEAWQAWCVLCGRPVVKREYGQVIADAQHMMPAEDAEALGAEIREEIVKRYAAAFPADSGPRLMPYDGWYVRVAGVSSREAEIIAPILLDSMCAVLSIGPELEGEGRICE